MLKALLSILLICLCSLLTAQPVLLQGTVLGNDGKSINGASIKFRANDSTGLIHYFKIADYNSSFSRNIPNNTLYIKYEMMYPDGTGYNEMKQWFTANYTIYSWFPPQYKMKEVPVIVDGKQILTSDTVMYAAEFKEMNDAIANMNKSLNLSVMFRSNESDILFMNTKFSDKEKYCVVDTLKQMTEWTILPDTLTLLGYPCQKATTNFYGTTYTACFTTELGFSGGPKNFRGLPGIILKVEDATKTIGYAATEIIYPFTGKLPEAKQDGMLVSQKEYNLIVDRDGLQIRRQLENMEKGLVPNKNN